LLKKLSIRTGNREQGTGNREQGTGNREQGTGNREQGTGNRSQVLRHGDREQVTGNRGQGTVLTVWIFSIFQIRQRKMQFITLISGINYVSHPDTKEQKPKV